MLDVARFYSESLEEHIYPIVQLTYEGLADRQVYTLARKITEGRPDTYVDGMPAVRAWQMTHFIPEEGPSDSPDWETAIRRIWGFLVLNVDYAPDPEDFELNMSLELTLDAGEGDCDDMVIALATLLKALEYEVEGRVVSLDDDWWSHIYLRVRTPVGWVTLDPTVRNALPGWEYPKIKAVADFAI